MGHEVSNGGDSDRRRKINRSLPLPVLTSALAKLGRREAPPYKLLVPYHSFKAKDAMPLVPGQIAELKFGLQPTSVLIKKGHRLRIAIAGADKNTFARIPTQGTPTISLPVIRTMPPGLNCR